MRIQVSHITTYRYEQPAQAVIQTLRLTPRSHDGQHVAYWRTDVSADCRLSQHDDAFGNITHSFTAEGPLTELAVAVEGEVETIDTQGVVRGAIERFPPSLFLRETELSAADVTISDYAATLRDGREPLDFLHELLRALNRDMTFDPRPTGPATTAAEAFALRRGVCQDLSHIFIAACRSQDIPARYVGGHFHRADGVVHQDAGHAWAEAFVPDLGWVAFDPTNGISATEAHIRVAIGLDYLNAAPVRGTRTGGSGEQLDVKVQVRQAGDQSQA